MHIDPAEVRACKGEIGEFLCSLSFAARGRLVFAHGGNAGGRTVAQLTSDGEGRAVWMDAGLPDRGERELLADYARALGVAHIVEGHVPSPVVFADKVTRNRGEMFQRFGLLFLSDTGMSEGVDNSDGAVLHITLGGGDEKAVAICPDGTKSPLWDNHNKQDIGRAAPCGR